MILTGPLALPVGVPETLPEAEPVPYMPTGKVRVLARVLHDDRPHAARRRRDSNFMVLELKLPTICLA